MRRRPRVTLPPLGTPRHRARPRRFGPPPRRPPSDIVGRRLNRRFTHTRHIGDTSPENRPPRRRETCPWPLDGLRRRRCLALAPGLFATRRPGGSPFSRPSQGIRRLATYRLRRRPPYTRPLPRPSDGRQPVRLPVVSRLVGLERHKNSPKIRLREEERPFLCRPAIQGPRTSQP